MESNVTPLSFYKCLADDTRLRSLLLIQTQGELCVCELTGALRQSQPKISRHLAQLRQCGLLEDRRQGQWVFYRLNPELPLWCKTVLQVTAQENEAVISEDTEALLSMDGRPGPTRLCC